MRTSNGIRQPYNPYRLGDLSDVRVEGRMQATSAAVLEDHHGDPAPSPFSDLFRPYVWRQSAPHLRPLVPTSRAR